MKNPATARAWQQLEHLAGESQQVLISNLCDDPERYRSYSLDIPSGAGGWLHADLSRHLVTDEVRGALTQLAQAVGVADRRDAMFRGEQINESEGRAVLHTALRNQAAGDQAREDFAADRRAMANLCRKFDAGWVSATGKRITDLINIGIGGSDLGPKMASLALRDLARPDLRCHFISNVDGAEIHHLLKGLDPECTAIVISSKTFTTSETLLNADTAMNWLAAAIPQLASEPARSPQVFGVTANPAAASALGVPDEQILRFDESIGGRYSLWSAIGLPLALSIGFDNFTELQAGAAVMDEHFLTAPPASNLPMLMALIGVWYNNFIRWRSQAVVPYCQRLSLLVDYLQQLEMESNGKSASLDNQPVSVHTAPVLWGQTGTNGQHAFFQMLHQGTEPVPVDFIGLVNDASSEPRHHQALKANMLAQAEALMRGRSSDSPHTHYPGNRPSTVILLDTLTPRTLGMLLALYEHKVFVQGCIWNINSFDQWGVELGKDLAGRIMQGASETGSQGFTALLKRAGL